MVPHLTTSLTGPLHDLERLVLDRRPEIERWFRARFAEHEVPFYSSVDLRNSGFKLAPVDTNLFPGGFNNLNPDFLPLCVHAAMSAVQKLCPDAQRFVLVPENHTRNLFYLQNVATLKRILEGAGLAVRIGSLIPDLAGPDARCETAGGDKLLLEPLQRKGNRVVLEGFDPCAVAPEQRPVRRESRRSCASSSRRSCRRSSRAGPRAASRSTSTPTSAWPRTSRSSSASTPGS